MIKLKQDDIIDYNLKMTQFRNQLEQSKAVDDDDQVRCPYCKSTNVKKISGTERVTSVAMLGIFSKKINKSFKCNNCSGTF